MNETKTKARETWDDWQVAEPHYLLSTHIMHALVASLIILLIDDNSSVY